MKRRPRKAPRKPNLREALAKKRGGAREGTARPMGEEAQRLAEIRNAARLLGTNQLANCVRLWTRLVETGLMFMDGKLRVGRRRGRVNHIPEEYAGPIMRASENLANRCGLPILSELSVKGAVPPKLLNEGKGAGWIDTEGTFHPVDVEGAPTEIVTH